MANVLWGLARLQMQQSDLDVQLSLIEEYVVSAASFPEDREKIKQWMF